MNLKRTWRTAVVGAATIAATLALSGTALASTTTSRPVSADTTSAAVATPAGSFHVPVVPVVPGVPLSQAFGGSYSTAFNLYSVAVVPPGSIGYQVVLTEPGDQGYVAPPNSSTIILTSITGGELQTIFPAGSAPATIPDPISDISFADSGLNGFISGAGNWVLAIKFFGPPTQTTLTGVWWTTIHFDGPASLTNHPNWSWEPLAGGL